MFVNVKIVTLYENKIYSLKFLNLKMRKSEDEK